MGIRTLTTAWPAQRGKHNHTLTLPRFYCTRSNIQAKVGTLKKGVVVERLALKYGNIFKNGQQKNISAKQR